LEPLLPTPAVTRRGGRPRHRSRRELIDGIRWRFQTRSRWDKLPPRYGPHQTAYALFRAWRADGTWDRLVQAMGATAEARAIIPWADEAVGSAAGSAVSTAVSTAVRSGVSSAVSPAE
jgi:transposase